MIIEKELLALNDIAEICNTTSSNVSNWRTRDSRFPAPYTEISGRPVWKGEDIVEYLKKKNEYDVISTGNLKSKRIAVIGRARGGKSFFTSRFVNDKLGFVELFCGNNSDKTACPINIRISENVAFESFTFHSDFSSKFSDKDTDVELLKDKVSTLVDNTYLQSDREKMEEIEDVIRKIRKVEEKYNRETRTYIDTYQKPSSFCKELLRECNLGFIEIVDTPGVSGKVEASRTAKSDIYFFLIKPDNGDESLTLKKVVTTIKPDVATSKVAFLYKKEGFFITQKKYEDAKKDVKKDMEAYSELFADLKGSIVSTDLDVLNPAGHCILFPTMDPEDITLPEELFLQDIKEKLVDAFKPADDENEDAEFSDIIKVHGTEARELVLSIMKGIPVHELNDMKSEYSEEQFMNEHHDRVMTNDGYRLRNDLDRAYNTEIRLLDRYFSAFMPSDYPEEWKQQIIKYVYKKLMSSVRNDRGLGIGSHPWEEKPARTMLVEEAIVANKVLRKVLPEDEWRRNNPYREALQSGNISSATWNCVGCINDEDAIIKLKIIDECLSDISVSSREKMVLCRYVGGLRKMAQWKILGIIGYTNTEKMKILRELPF